MDFAADSLGEDRITIPPDMEICDFFINIKDIPPRPQNPNYRANHKKIKPTKFNPRKFYADFNKTAWKCSGCGKLNSKAAKQCLICGESHRLS